MTFYISPSRLSSFYTCPASYQYRMNWERKELPPAIRDGIAAHQMLSDEVPERMTSRARSFFEALSSMRREGGYEILASEVRQEIPLGDDIILVRVIDAIAKLNGVPILVDYKTATWPWKAIDGTGLYPKAMGFQAVAYLIPPPDPSPLKRWPEKIDFLVAPEKGAEAVYSYEYFEEDQDNLMQAIELVRSAGVYPRNRSYGCNYCSFMEMCYGLPRWEDLYLPKGELKDD